MSRNLLSGSDMIDIVAAFHAHRGDGVLFARLGDLRGAIGGSRRQTIYRQGLKRDAVRQTDAGRQNGAGTDTVPLTQAG